jgi:hypothetical protein
MQQAIEKITKTWIFLHNLSKIPLIGHSPLMFMDEVIAQRQLVREKAIKHGVDLHEGPLIGNQDRYIQQCKDIVKELESNNRGRIKSIKIALWKNTLRIELDDADKQVFAKYPDFKSYYMFHMGGVIASTTDMSKGDKFDQDVNKSPDTAKLGVYNAVLTYGRMIVCAFPHEEYGRYPTDIPTKTGPQTSTKLYERHKDELKEMIDIVAKAIPTK